MPCRQDRRWQWRMFDVNLKPNLTGRGRPGRDDQDSLLAIALASLSWSYPQLIEHLTWYRWNKTEFRPD